MKNFKRLSTEIIFSLSMITGLFFIASGIILAFHSYNKFQNQFVENTYYHSISDMKDKIDNKLSESKKILFLLSDSLIVKDLCLGNIEIENVNQNGFIAELYDYEVCVYSSVLNMPILNPSSFHLSNVYSYLSNSKTSYKSLIGLADTENQNLWQFTSIAQSGIDLGFIGFGFKFEDIVNEYDLFEKNGIFDSSDEVTENLFFVNQEGVVINNKNTLITNTHNIFDYDIDNVNSEGIIKTKNKISGEKVYLGIIPINGLMNDINEYYLITVVYQSDIRGMFFKKWDYVLFLSIIFYIVMALLGSLLMSIKIVSPLEKLRQAAESISKNNFEAEIPQGYRNEIGLLSDSIAVMRDNLRNYHNHLEGLVSARTGELQDALNQITKQEELLEKEVYFASVIQAGLIPSNTRWGDLSLYSYVKELKGVGGDIIDIIQKDGQMACYLADISGFGVPASLISMLTKLTFIHSFYAFNEIEEMIKEVNSYINDFIFKQDLKYVNYFTAFFMVFNQDNQFDYISAGHIPSIIYRAKQNKCDILSGSSSMLGVFESDIVKYQVSHDKLEPGDKILVFSDGFINSKGLSGRKYGLDRLMKAVSENASLRGGEFQKSILSGHERFIQDIPQDDDLSLFIIER